MPIGALFGLLMICGFLVWGIAIALRKRSAERASETSSHYESGIGTSGGGPVDVDR